MTPTIPQTTYDRIESEWRQMREVSTQPKPSQTPKK